MPLYDFQHVTPLSDAQKDELALQITKLHTNEFRAPSLFVNVYFTDISARATYVGGKRRPANHLVARVRLGSRKSEQFQRMARSIEQTWEKVVVQATVEQGEPATNLKNLKLSTIILMPVNTVGLEAGFPLPIAGEDGLWLAKHKQEFERRADAGDDNMKGVVAELREKSLL